MLITNTIIFTVSTVAAWWSLYKMLFLYRKTKSIAALAMCLVIALVWMCHMFEWNNMSNAAELLLSSASVAFAIITTIVVNHASEKLKLIKEIIEESRMTCHETDVAGRLATVLTRLRAKIQYYEAEAKIRGIPLFEEKEEGAKKQVQP